MTKNNFFIRLFIAVSFVIYTLVKLIIEAILSIVFTIVGFFMILTVGFDYTDQKLNELAKKILK